MHSTVHPQNQPRPLALVVEDEEHLTSIFEKAVDMAGYHVEIIKDGHVALKRLDEVVPQLILLDLHLPFVNGETILNAIRTNDKLSKTRVILATADARLGDFLDEKADVVLIKPIRFSLLKEIAARFNV
ncbi:MAG: response regulator [Chloroflexota bacterium]